MCCTPDLAPAWAAARRRRSTPCSVLALVRVTARAAGARTPCAVEARAPSSAVASDPTLKAGHARTGLAAASASAEAEGRKTPVVVKRRPPFLLFLGSSPSWVARSRPGSRRRGGGNPRL